MLQNLNCSGGRSKCCNLFATCSNYLGVVGTRVESFGRFRACARRSSASPFETPALTSHAASCHVRRDTYLARRVTPKLADQQRRRRLRTLTNRTDDEISLVVARVEQGSQSPRRPQGRLEPPIQYPERGEVGAVGDGGEESDVETQLSSVELMQASNGVLARRRRDAAVCSRPARPKPGPGWRRSSSWRGAPKRDGCGRVITIGCGHACWILQITCCCLSSCCWFSQKCCQLAVGVAVFELIFVICVVAGRVAQVVVDSITFGAVVAMSASGQHSATAMSLSPVLGWALKSQKDRAPQQRWQQRQVGTSRQ